MMPNDVSDHHLKQIQQQHYQQREHQQQEGQQGEDERQQQAQQKLHSHYEQQQQQSPKPTQQQETIQRHFECPEQKKQSSIHHTLEKSENNNDIDDHKRIPVLQQVACITNNIALSSETNTRNVLNYVSTQDVKDFQYSFGDVASHETLDPHQIIQPLNDYEKSGAFFSRAEDNYHMSSFDDFEDDCCYEDLDLNFDDLYSEDCVQEEYFIQQSPLTLQHFGHSHDSQHQHEHNMYSDHLATTTNSTRPSQVEPTSVEIPRRKNHSLSDLDNVDRTDYYSLDSKEQGVLCQDDNSSQLHTARGTSSSDRIDSETESSSSQTNSFRFPSEENTVSPYYEYDDYYHQVICKPSEKVKCDDFGDEESTSSNNSREGSYILGTLIVRVAAAKGLASVNNNLENHSSKATKSFGRENSTHRSRRKGGGFRAPFFFGRNDDGYDPEGNNGPGTNPYVSVRFTILSTSLPNQENPSRGSTSKTDTTTKRFHHQQVQRTSTLYNTCNPLWPRSEYMYMDVTHPMPAKVKVESNHVTKAQSNLVTTLEAKSNQKEQCTKSMIDCANPGYHPGAPPTKFTSHSHNGTNDRTLNDLVSSKQKQHLDTDLILSPILSCAFFHSPSRSIQDDGSDWSQNRLDTIKKQNVYNSSKDRTTSINIQKHGVTNEKMTTCSSNISNSTSSATVSGDSDDLFLGMASLDVTALLTGKVSRIDEWICLSGGAATTFTNSDHHNSTRPNNHRQKQQAQVRIVCEYEPTDSPPDVGCFVKFTQFCHPADLYPLLNPHNINAYYKVEDVLSIEPAGGSVNDASSSNVVDDVDYVMISHTEQCGTVEGWVSTFLVHRNMLLVCKERELTIFEKYHDELLTVANRITHSPLVHAVQETVHVRVPEDGLLPVSAEIMGQAINTIWNRWIQNDRIINTVVEDLKYVTNWEGRHQQHHNPLSDTQADSSFLANESNSLQSSLNRFSSSEMGYGQSVNNDRLRTKTVLDLVSDDSRGENHPKRSPSSIPQPKVSSSSSKALLPNMPSCPITGMPMQDPVVAADGHTYERSAIGRWLDTHDTSPLTGIRLEHKNLVPNYMLVSSLQELMSSASSSKSPSLPPLSSSEQQQSDAMKSPQQAPSTPSLITGTDAPHDRFERRLPSNETFIRNGFVVDEVHNTCESMVTLRDSDASIHHDNGALDDDEKTTVEVSIND